MKTLKITALVILLVLLLLALILVAYVIYLSVNYYRIDDHQKLDIEGFSQSEILPDEEYTALTYNIGFGAYDREFSFFMDKGTMKDGTEVTGKYGKARNKDATEKNTAGVIKVVNENNADFNLFQEVDQEATRSYFINQEDEIKNALRANNDINSVFASNFHSKYLFYPFNDPIGRIESGLLTTGKYQIIESMRRSFPVTDSYINKFFDLDRCFVVNRIPVGDGDIDFDPHLVLINLHMSAYDKGGTIRKQQMEMLSNVMSEEVRNGNWVMVGGDFNHSLFGTEKSFDSDQEIPDWIQPFDDESLPAGIRVVKANNIKNVATVRSTDIPYKKGVNYLAVIDGFMVSKNIEASAENIDAGFYYTDHNPVLLKFKLKY